MCLESGGVRRRRCAAVISRGEGNDARRSEEEEETLETLANEGEEKYERFVMEEDSSERAREIEGNSRSLIWCKK